MGGRKDSLHDWCNQDVSLEEVVELDLEDLSRFPQVKLVEGKKRERLVCEKKIR